MGRSPAAARRRLGLELKSLREGVGKQLADAAVVLDCSSSKVSRLENGKGIPRARDVRDLLELYGPVSDEQSGDLYDLAADGRGQGWWDPFRRALDGAMVPEHLLRLVAFESDARAIRSYEPNMVPGLLQPPGYIEAVIDLYFADYAPEQRRALVEFRVKRQAVLTDSDRPIAVIVMGETALHRRIGPDGADTEWFAELAASLENGLSHVDFRIAPLSLTTTATLGGPFHVLELPDGDEESVVYVEGVAGATYVELADEVAKYQNRFGDLLDGSLSRAESVDLLKEFAKQSTSH